MSPRDISGNILRRPLRSPYGRGSGGSRKRWLVIGGVTLWVLWVGVVSDDSLWRIFRLKHDLGAAKTDIARVERETAKLDARLNDPAERDEHAEEALRGLGMARPGETIYRLGTGRADSTARANR